VGTELDLSQQRAFVSLTISFSFQFVPSSCINKQTVKGDETEDNRTPDCKEAIFDEEM